VLVVINVVPEGATGIEVVMVVRLREPNVVLCKGRPSCQKFQRKPYKEPEAGDSAFLKYISHTGI
jgi:hypothetical protein